MRYWIIILVIFLVACGGRVEQTGSFVDRDAGVGPDGKKDANPEAIWQTVASGEFEGQKTYGAAGRATIVQNDALRVLTFTGFWVDAAPDLKVYLSKDGSFQNAVDLGVLERINGEQSYGIPGFVDMSEYRYVVIHSRSYNDVVALAPLSR